MCNSVFLTMKVTLSLKGVFITFDNLLVHQFAHTWLLSIKFSYELPMWYTIGLYKSLKIFRLVFCRFLDLYGNLGTIDWPLKSDYSSLQNFVMNNPITNSVIQDWRWLNKACCLLCYSEHRNNVRDLPVYCYIFKKEIQYIKLSSWYYLHLLFSCVLCLVLKLQNPSFLRTLDKEFT